MVDPTQLEPQKIDSTQPGSKIFDTDPSLFCQDETLFWSGHNNKIWKIK